MARVWGINCFGHDASICVAIDNEIVSHQVTKDEFLSTDMVQNSLRFGYPDLICYYEKPFIKRTRQFYSGEWNKAFSLLTPKMHFMEHGLFAPVKYFSHHQSHAAASYFLSQYDDCIIFVADAIGEWDTFSIWEGKGNNLKKIYSKKYPYSLGLFYSAFTKLHGLQPLRDESKFMRLSYEGKYDASLYEKIKSRLNENNHKGITDWIGSDSNLPFNVQKVFEDEIEKHMTPFKDRKILFAGGCAYNKKLVDKLNLEVVINPGDSSSSIGAVAAYIKQKLKITI